MKNLSVIAAVVVTCSIAVTANANTHGGGDVSVAPAVHHSSSAPIAPTTTGAPRLGGMSSYPRSLPTTYRRSFECTPPDSFERGEFEKHACTAANHRRKLASQL